MSTITLGVASIQEPTSSASRDAKLERASIRDLYFEAKSGVVSSVDNKTVADFPLGALSPKPIPTTTFVPKTAPRAKSDTVSRPLAEWQGYVTMIEGDTIYAKLEGVYGYDVKGKMFDTSIPLSEVAPDDFHLVKPGAYFRMAVAYEVTHSGFGTSSRTSRVAFRRLPVFQQSEIAESRQLAQELLSGIRLE